MGTYFSLQSLETFHDPFQECSPIKGYGKPMGPVPYLSLMYVWDRSHVFLQDMYGAGPVGLQNKEIHKTSTKAFN